MPQISFEAKIGMMVLIVLMVVAIFVYHVLLDRLHGYASRRKANEPAAKPGGGQT